jgi:hypothetical protein
MTTSADALAKSIEHAANIVLFFTEDLTGQEWVHRACPGGNCAAWTLGHLVLSARGMMQRSGHSDFPALPEGFETRFARDESAPKSDDFGDVAILRPLFKQYHDLFASVARRQTPESLAVEIDPKHRIFYNVGSMLAFAPVHIASHAGQISVIRRSLGRKPLV